MGDTVSISLNSIYSAWRTYLLANSVAKHFGMVNDHMVAEFPYANLQMIGRPTNRTDLENHEITVDLTLQTDCYVDSDKVLDLYGMDDACWQFFQSLGFRRMGDSVLSVVYNSNVKRITSRFYLRNFSGRFLKELN